MTEREVTALLDRLVERFDDEVGDWDDVLERAAKPALVQPHKSARSWRSRLGRGRGVYVFAAALVITAVIVLASAAPWRGGPNVLDRAAAAIASPVPGKILHESITIHATPTLPPGRLPHLPPGILHPPYSLVAHVNVWMTNAAPHRFRLTEDGSESGVLRGEPTTIPLRPTEIGGTLRRLQGLSYDTTVHALDPVTFAARLRRSQLDVAEFVWQAITSGHAKVDGTTVLRGRSVVRIRLFAHLYGHLKTVALYFVDATTYRPVRVEMQVNDLPYQAIPGFPLLSLTTIQASSLPNMLGHYVLDFEAYRYLSPTPANESLASIRATHPRAKII